MNSTPAIPILLSLLSTAFWGVAHGQDRKFFYDAADQTLTPSILEGPECYDADVAADGDQLWITWLEFVPGQGDRLWVGNRRGEDWAVKGQVKIQAARGNRVALSASGEFAGEEIVIFDSQTGGMYPETERGQVFGMEPVRARYIRNWLLDNTNNPSCQWVEIEVYAPLPEEGGEEK